MKKIKQTYSILILSLLLLGGINSSTAQDRTDSFEKTFKISSTGSFNFSCYETDLKVNTWNKNEVKMKGEIIIRGGDQADQDKLLEVFKNPDVSQSSDALKIETNIAKSTIVLGPFKKITLVNGKTIRVDKYEVKYTLWIPEEISFLLKSKYNDIDIATLKGSVNFELYEVDLTLASFKHAKFNMKYSTAEIGKGESAKLDVYECDLEIKDISKIMANTKYSNYIIGNASILAIDSYEDNFEVENLSKGLTGKAKYSDFEIKSNVSQIKMDVYETDIETVNVDNIEYAGKYSTLKTGNINTLMCKSMYEVKIYANNVGAFSCDESKYDNISFQKITQSIYLPSTYELDMNVQLVGPEFKKFYGDFKYGSINLPLNTGLDFSLKFETKYGDVDFPKNRLKIIEMDFEDNKKSFYGQTVENAPCRIEFTAYDTEFDLN